MALSPHPLRRLLLLSSCAGLFGWSGCQSTSPSATPSAREAAVPPPLSEPPPPSVSAAYNDEIRAILNQARAGDWIEAETAAADLKRIAPTDPAVDRIHTWVMTEGQRRRDRALETEFRQIEAQDSRFANKLSDVLLDADARSLDLPRSLRGALDDVEKASNIPEPYGRTIERSAPMVGLAEAPASQMDEVLKKTMTLQVDDVTLESIIFTVGKSTGINFVADRSLPQFQRKLSVNLRDVPVSQFLDFVARQMDLHFEIGENLVWIVEAKDAKKSGFEETRFYRLRRGFILPAHFVPTEISETRVKDKDKETITNKTVPDSFVRDGAPAAPSIDQAIKQFFAGSKYLIDYERNIIVATGTRAQLRAIEDIIREFDRPIQQVLIEARFITISESAFQQLGVNWETGRALNAPRAAVDYTGLGTNVGLGLQKTFTDVMGDDSLTATLNAIEQSGEAQTLSAPRLTVVNNRPASIRDGLTQYFYEEYTVSQTILENRSTSSLVPKGKPTKLAAGVSLDVLASIGGDGRSIMLALNPVVSQDVELVTFATISDLDEQGRVVNTFDIKLPQSRDQEIATRVIVQSGETVVMGGVIENEQSTFTESVPILGKLPLIGAAFRTKTEISKPRYLLIFVTATLLSETGEFIRYGAPT
ncbi:MAG: type II secretion system protein GspD, partial [Burkholderiales bacterium]|nr:type II secretion system protein GspD [Opitutaceae bacterium]